jgi:hypothetical protein
MNLPDLGVIRAAYVVLTRLGRDTQHLVRRPLPSAPLATRRSSALTRRRAPRAAQSISAPATPRCELHSPIPPDQHGHEPKQKDLGPHYVP